MTYIKFETVLSLFSLLFSRTPVFFVLTCIYLLERHPVVQETVAPGYQETYPLFGLHVEEFRD